MVNFVIYNATHVMVAIIIDLILGDPPWLPHPVVLIGKLIKYIEGRSRVRAKNNKQLKYYGAIMVVVVCFISFGVPAILLCVTWKIKSLFHIVNIIILWTTIAARCLKDESMKVYFALQNSDIPLARTMTSYIVGRDTKTLQEEGLVRATVETVAENTSDGVIAPLLFGFIGGAPLAMMYKGINTMDSMVGYMNPPFIDIGYFPAKIDDIFNFIPARITGLFMCLTAPFMGASIINSIKIMFRDRKNHKSPNCAYPEAAVAAILKVQLGGDNIYFNQVIQKPTIGDEIRKLIREDIILTNKIMLMTEFLFVLVIIGLIRGF